jgi:hypothetical protein
MNSGTLGTGETMLVPAIFSDREHAEAAVARATAIPARLISGERVVSGVLGFFGRIIELLRLGLVFGGCGWIVCNAIGLPQHPHHFCWRRGGKDNFTSVRDAQGFKRQILEQKAGAGAKSSNASQLLGQLAALRDAGVLTPVAYVAKSAPLLNRA